MNKFDIAIIGGGINGCGIARDAASRGAKVFLCEKGDLASATSSSSTKLIHGGLRYLEYYDFRLVHEALKEREILLKNAPHIITPLHFILPHNKNLRPTWMIRIGLFIYDNLGGKKSLPSSGFINFKNSEYGKPLVSEIRTGFEYSDCLVQDSRLVILNAMSAASKGAEISPRTECISAKRKNNAWQIELLNKKNNQKRVIEAKILVNASGPWASSILGQQIEAKKHSLILSKGSHIVVNKLFDHDSAYIFQNKDKRIVFAIPFEQDFTLIGTTDVEFSGDPDNASISDEETEYLCNSVNNYFKKRISKADIIWSYSGVRPLAGKGKEKTQEVSRDYVLDADGDANNPLLLNVFGGKITTYRKLAESACEIISGYYSFNTNSCTENEPLPGGDISNQLYDELHSSFNWLPENLCQRYANSYGSLANKILKNCSKIEDLGKNFGGGLFEAEIRYLVDEEWAQTAEDILWRRTKLGLHLSENTVAELAQWLQQNFPC